MEKSLKLENTRKVPIVVPKVTFLGTFGTIIGTFCKWNLLSSVIQTPIQTILKVTTISRIRQGLESYAL